MQLSLLKTFTTLILAFLFLPNTGIAEERHHRVEVSLDGRPLVEVAETGIAMDIASLRPGVSFLAELSDTELRSLSDAGFTYEVLIEDMSAYYQERNRGFDIDEFNRTMGTRDNGTPYPTPDNFSLGSMGGFHTNSEAMDDLDDMRDLFPNLISERMVIGETTTIEDRNVYYVRISNDPDVEQDKPKVLYTALTHAREPASLQQMLFQMWYLLENYDSDPEIQYLIDNMEMYFVPVVNPDGYVYCETTHPNGGSMHRKNMRVNSNGSIGVDLNRNFGYKWGYDNTGSSPNPSMQTYRGTAPFSEPETQLQKELAENYDFKLALNNHTFSDLLIYPWGYNDQLTPDGDIFIEYADYMTRENGYVYGTCYETLGYFANGVSDDWFYGEQDTKDKVFAFTPEAGSPADGFWPAIDRIEEICAGHTHMNLGLARLALEYAELTELSGDYISERTTSIEFEVLNLGQSSPADYTVSLIPVTNNILEAGDPVGFENMEVLDLETGHITMELQPYINTGDEITFVLSLDNGSFAWNDTITKFYGQPEIVFHDSAENMDNWNTDNWGLCTQHYYSEPSSFADSPGSDYSSNAHETIIIAEPFDLSETTLAWVEFQTRFHIEANWDYAQFLYSIDGQQSWVPLPGEYTDTGGSNQDPGEPLYHGSQTNWVQEQTDLSHLAGEEEVWLKFRLVSDHIINYEGFYFDEFKLFTLDYDISFHFFPPEEVSFYQHQEKVLDFADYINWQPEGEVEITWEGSDNFHVEVTSQTVVTISNADPQWTGQEQVSFSIADDLGAADGNILVISMEVPAPEITGQEEKETQQGVAFDIHMHDLHVEDPHFSYPDDFTLTVHEGDHFTLSGDHTIIPDDDFSGWLEVPLTVNNGFKDSDLYHFGVDVDASTDISGTQTGEVRIYYDQSAREVVVILPSHKNISTADIAIRDVSGRKMLQQKLDGDQHQHRISLHQLGTGVFIISLRGDLNASEKIIIH